MSPLNFDDLTEDNLQKLIDNDVLEMKTLEYKLQLPGSSDKEKKEFLADISSFANATGGYIIYGMKEDDGHPVELIGIPISDINSEILRFESIIQSGISPRIPNINSKYCKLSNGNYAIIYELRS